MKTSKVEKSQVDKFREAARELETDDSEEHFKDMVKKIARPTNPPVAKNGSDKNGG